MRLRDKRLVIEIALFMAVWTQSGPAGAQIPEWIWHDNKGVAPQDNEIRFFRKEFRLPNMPTQAELLTAGDDQAEVYLNGKLVARSRSWNKAVWADLSNSLLAGKNVLAARGRNGSGDAAFIAKLVITLNNQKQLVVTDPSWVSSTREEAGWQNLEFTAAGWSQALSRGKLGVMPWGDIMSPPAATPAASLGLLPGFKAELIRTAQRAEGSWICMTVDQKGRLIISPQEDEIPLLRLTLDASGQVGQIEKIAAPMRQAMGLLYAHNSLYVNGHYLSHEGRRGTGLYRLVDANSNDQFEPEEVALLKNFAGEGEHGYHGVVLGPDGMIYVMNGNHTKLPDGISPQSPHQNYAEDLLLPRLWDAGGHAVNIYAPGGHIARTDPEGKNWELLLAGFRNAYDFDFNTDGEIFTYDSDMEWDWGLPWYRPTRINHCVLGGEYGWRSGSGKWPAYYPDSLPSTVDIGIGSPTGVKFGARSRYPAKYQKALFAMDWSYGRILAVHLTPKGATYTGGFETFVQGKPLNVADLEFGNDGAMYFITGGRGTQSGLYRVSYVGPAPAPPSPASAKPDASAAEARALRRRLESYHGKQNSAALEAAWPQLNSPDGWIRYAARVAIESQPVHLWQNRALEEARTDASITALLALARKGSPNIQKSLIEALGKLKEDALTEEQTLAALRVLSLAFIRMGKPDAETRQDVIARLDRLYPAKSQWVNRELLQLLVYLEAPGVVEKTFALLEAAPTQEEQIHYIFHLRNLKSGWTLDQRRRYFSWFNRSREGLKHPPELIQWFNDVGREYADGASFAKYLVNFRKDAVAGLSDQERAALALTLTGQTAAPQPAVPQRSFVKEWKLDDLLPGLDKVSRGRSFEKGKDAFAATQCLACHKMGNEGGGSGPDLTAISSRFTRRDILESTIDPSKIVSEQYQNTTFYLKAGDEITGRVLDENANRVVLLINPLTQQQTRIPKTQIERRQPSKLSSMPDGLLNVLTQEGIFDLLAYLEAGGRSDHSAFLSR